jgi:general nucleoside transport system ATP-binding protein
MPLLRMENVTKAFPGVVANAGVTFELEGGEIHALVGENGAGKTTLMRILYGLYRPDAGTIAIEGRPVSIRGARDAIRAGIGMVHQHFMLIPPFTVLENVVLGEETHTLGVLRMRQPRARVAELARANGLEVDLDAPVEQLPVGLQQRVEILKVLYRGARILVFDEPTAVLTPQETRELFATFRQMTRQGRGIVFISHKLDEVLEIADRITVIRRGRVVRTLAAAEASKPLIAELMVGKPVMLAVDKPLRVPGPPVLEVRDLTVRDDRGVAVLDGVSLTVHAGEIYGIAGVEGNGQTPLVQAIADRVPIAGGDVRLQGASIARWDVRARREHGIAHIPEDRHRYGLLLPFAVADNTALGRHHARPFVRGFQWIDRRAIVEHAERLVRSFDVRTPSVATPAAALSGGNQQKLILAREITAQPRLLLASQPTRGVDVGATEFIYRQIVGEREAGRAVLLVSADLDEIMALSDRIGVLYKGRLIREFRREDTTRDEVGFYMMGERRDA